MKRGQFEFSDFFAFFLLLLITIALLGLINFQKNNLNIEVTEEFSSGQLMLTTFLRSPTDFEGADNMADVLALGLENGEARNELQTGLLRLIDEIETEEASYKFIVHYDNKLIFFGNKNLEVDELKGESIRDLLNVVKTEIYVPAFDGTPIKVEIWSE